MLTVTYDESDKDVPAICVMQSDINANYKCLKMLIGDQAKLLYRALTEQSFEIVEKKWEANNDICSDTRRESKS